MFCLSYLRPGFALSSDIILLLEGCLYLLFHSFFEYSLPTVINIFFHTSKGCFLLLECFFYTISYFLISTTLFPYLTEIVVIVLGLLFPSSVLFDFKLQKHLNVFHEPLAWVWVKSVMDIKTILFSPRTTSPSDLKTKAREHIEDTGTCCICSGFVTRE